MESQDTIKQIKKVIEAHDDGRIGDHACANTLKSLIEEYFSKLNAASGAKESITFEEMASDVKNLWFGIEGKEAQGYIALCLAGEVGELCNYIKKEIRSAEHRQDKSKEIEMEVPDVAFYLAALMNARNINFFKAWHVKMNHNERKYGRENKKRPYECGCDICLESDLKNWQKTHCTICNEPLTQAIIDKADIPWCDACIDEGRREHDV